MSKKWVALFFEGAAFGLLWFLMFQLWPQDGSDQAVEEERPLSLIGTVGAGFSFFREPFVHPRIVQDLSTWLSDGGDQVVAINLTESNESNRYFGDVHVIESSEGCPIVRWEVGDWAPRGEQQSFSYVYVGMTDSGVHVLWTSSWGGGSGRFRDLLFVTLEGDYGLSSPDFGFHEGSSRLRQDRLRILLRKLGATSLGDRWSGDLEVRGNTVFIGEDEGWFSQAEGHDREPRLKRQVSIEASPKDPLALLVDDHGDACK